MNKRTFIMTKKQIIEIALSCFSIDYDKIGEDSDEVKKCSIFLRQSEEACARYYDWSFLMKDIAYSDEDIVEGESFRNMGYCYAKPSDMVKVLYVNDVYNEDVYVIGGHIYTAVENPKITYISSKVDYDNWSYPDTYGYLLGYMLASYVISFLRPDDPNISNNIQGLFNLSFQSLVSSERFYSRKKNPPQNKYVIGAPNDFIY